MHIAPLLFAALFAAPALAACDVVTDVIGPTKRDVQDALDDYFNPPPEFASWSKVAAKHEPYRHAEVLSRGPCDRLGYMFICDVDFRMPDGKRVTVRMDMMKGVGQPTPWHTYGPILP
jgi:hypothetical protein